MDQRRPLAFVALPLVVALLCASRPARADHDPILGPPDSDAAKAKKNRGLVAL
jgi:hypothetical protein